MRPGFRRKLLVDPVVILGDPSDPKADYAAVDELETFFDLVERDRCSVPAPVLQESDWMALYDRRERVLMSRLARLRKYLSLEGPLAGSSAVLSKAPTDVPEDWFRTLAAETATDANGDWRTPAILVPRRRETSWSAGPLATVSPGGRERSLVVLEQAADHPYLALDVDPWLHRAPSNPVTRFPPDAAPRRKGHPMLPKPEELLARPTDYDSTDALGYPMDEWAARIAGRKQWLVRHADGRLRGSFVPPEDWADSGIDRARWHRFDAFGHATKGSRSGPVDRFDQVWWWDERERHWDVQDRSPSHPKDYITVSDTGEVRKICRNDAFYSAARLKDAPRIPTWIDYTSLAPAGAT